MSALSLADRIAVAIRRITSGHGAMRIPAEDTDPDLVLSECRARIEELERQLRTARAAAVAAKAEEVREACARHLLADEISTLRARAAESELREDCSVDGHKTCGADEHDWCHACMANAYRQESLESRAGEARAEKAETERDALRAKIDECDARLAAVVALAVDSQFGGVAP